MKTYITWPVRNKISLVVDNFDKQAYVVHWVEKVPTFGDDCWGLLVILHSGCPRRYCKVGLKKFYFPFIRLLERSFFFFFFRNFGP